MPRITQEQVQNAHRIVTQDLTKRLKNLKHGQSIRINNLGTLTKSQREITAWDGRTYIYWRINFRASATLKKELDGNFQ